MSTLAHTLLRALDCLGRPRVLVLGDLMLDRYIRGEVERISPEAPVAVLRVGATEERLGGAANVANMLRELEAEVVCGGVLGADDAGGAVCSLLENRGIEPALVVTDAARPTTVKERFLGLAAGRHSGQLLRVDRESTDSLSADLEARVLASLTGQLARVSAVLLSDYGKGFCTPRVLRAVIEESRRLRIPVLVDPSPLGRYERYRGATLLKPNRREAEQAAGERIADAADARRVARRLCREAAVALTVVTLDGDGMALAVEGGEAAVFPTHARAVCDITGAGDMVLAMLGLCLADGAPPRIAARLANVAAGLEVEREGVAVISREEIRRQIALLAPRRPGRESTRGYGEAAASSLVSPARKSG